MVAWIFFNLMFLLNNECKNSKEINIYIDYLKEYVEKCISKSIMFACILLKPSVLNKYEGKQVKKIKIKIYQ